MAKSYKILLNNWHIPALDYLRRRNVTKRTIARTRSSSVESESASVPARLKVSANAASRAWAASRKRWRK
jgi:hypothetical protein